MKFQAILAGEHRTIESMMDVLERAATRLERGLAVPDELLSGGLRFLSGFADGFHHQKEERAVFPLLAAHGIGPDQPFVNALLEQHEIGRAYVQLLESALDRHRLGRTEAARELARGIRDYAELLREHIRIEDVFFEQLASEQLSRADDDELVRDFATLEQERIPGASGPDQCRALLAECERLAADW